MTRHIRYSCEGKKRVAEEEEGGAGGGGRSKRSQVEEASPAPLLPPAPGCGTLPAAALAPPATMWKRSAEKEEMETIATKIIAKVRRLSGEALVEGDEEEALAVIGEAEQLNDRRISCPVITAET